MISKANLVPKVLQRKTTNESGLHQSPWQIGSKAILIEVHAASTNPVAEHKHTKGEVVIRVK